MAGEYAPAGFSFVFVYTREAHPGEKLPHHESLEQKLDHARAMVTRWKIRRTMLVDDLDGPVHRAYGTLPNMSYVLAVGGRILYRADWTDPENIRIVLDQIVRERKQRRSGTRLTPFYAEWLPQRSNDPIAFMEGLVEAGPRSVEEFIAATASWGGEASARPLRDWWEQKQAGGGVAAPSD